MRLVTGIAHRATAKKPSTRFRVRLRLGRRSLLVVTVFVFAGLTNSVNVRCARGGAG